MPQEGSHPQIWRVGALFVLALLASATLWTAQASATEATWHIDGQELEGVEEASFGSGSLGFNFPGWGVTVTCSIGGGEMSIFNQEGEGPPAQGDVWSKSMASTTCPTNGGENCVGTEAALDGYQWSAGFVEGNIFEMEFQLKANFVGGSCSFLAGKHTWSGTLAGEWDDNNGCVTFEDKYSDVTFSSFGKVLPYGKFCFSGPEGKELRITSPLPKSPPALWALNGKELNKGKENAVPIEALGELAFQINGSALLMGPCEVELDGSVWNGPQTGVGEITTAVATVPCQTNVSGCEITKVTANSGGPWPLAATMGEELGEIHIAGIDLTVSFNSYCVSLGVPSTIDLVGTLNGARFESGCVDFEEASAELELPLSKNKGRVLGYACLQPEGESGLTLQA